MNQDSHKPAKVGEAFLARDLNHNKWESKLYQFLLDVSRFGVGVIKTHWTKEQKLTKKSVTRPKYSFMGFSLGGQVSEDKMSMETTFLGNCIQNISPYRFYPDTRLPIDRFQEGEFCASEDEYSWIKLKQMEANGELAGLEFVKDVQFTDKMMKERGESRFANTNVQKDTTVAGNGQSKGTYILTEVQRKIIPSEYMIDGKPLGPETYPVPYVIQYVNDTRIVKCEPMNYAHGDFTYDVAQFNPDMHRMLNPGLSDSIDALQSVITWFINSRITSVRKVISNYLIVDPEGVEMQDLKDRNPIIRLKPNAAQRGGIDRWIKQLDVNDVTTGHIKDAEYLKSIVQEITGINENIMGQFHGGRRSAMEARNVSSNAAARLKMIAVIIFYSALEPMARKMLCNLRDGLDDETMVKVVGMDVAAEGAEFITANKGSLVGEYDFEVFDGTLPSEKVAIAQVLENYLLGLLKSPDAAIALGIDPKAMMLESMELRGIRNPRRFFLQAAPAPAAAPGQPGMPQLPPGPQGVPNAGTGISDLIQG
jgi:hypothetical protein